MVSKYWVKSRVTYNSIEIHLWNEQVAYFGKKSKCRMNQSSFCFTIQKNGNLWNVVYWWYVISQRYDYNYVITIQLQKRKSWLLLLCLCLVWSANFFMPVVLVFICVYYVEYVCGSYLFHLSFLPFLFKLKILPTSTVWSIQSPRKTSTPPVKKHPITVNPNFASISSLKICSSMFNA